MKVSELKQDLAIIYTIDYSPSLTVTLHHLLVLMPERPSELLAKEANADAGLALAKYE